MQQGDKEEKVQENDQLADQTTNIEQDQSEPNVESAVNPSDQSQSDSNTEIDGSKLQTELQQETKFVDSEFGESNVDSVVADSSKVQIESSSTQQINNSQNEDSNNNQSNVEKSSNDTSKEQIEPQPDSTQIDNSFTSNVYEPNANIVSENDKKEIQQDKLPDQNVVQDQSTDMAPNSEDPHELSQDVESNLQVKGQDDFPDVNTSADDIEKILMDNMEILNINGNPDESSSYQEGVKDSTRNNADSESLPVDQSQEQQQRQEPTETNNETAPNESPSIPLEFISADNPLIDRVQKALFSILSEKNTKLENSLYEKEEGVRKAQKEREQIGYDLYYLQQELSRVQTQIESTQEELNKSMTNRTETEKELKTLSAKYEQDYSTLQNFTTSLEHQKLDLEKVDKSLRQVLRYQDDVKSELKIAKRTSVKAEKELIKQEMEKKKQDYYIETMSEQLRYLQERCAMYESQLILQKNETKAATETLQEANTEMEAVMFEKKQLLQQWNYSLMSVKKRDELSTQLDQQLQKLRDQILSLQNEINGFKQTNKKNQEKQATLSSLLSKLESEMDQMKKQIEISGEQKEKLKESFAMFMKSLNQTQQELGLVNTERAGIQQEVNAIQKQRVKVVEEIRRLENNIREELQNQLAINKSAEGTEKDWNKLRNDIHEKESQISQIQNDIAIAKSESAMVTAKIDAYKDTLQEIDSQVREKNRLIEHYESEIRKRNDILTKKQSEVDLLNKRYDQLTSHAVDGGESVGPLEATIHQLSKEIAEKEKECMELQTYWMKSQTELVSLTKQGQAEEEKNQELSMRINILLRKKLQLSSQYEGEEKEFQEYQKRIRQLQNNMTKINLLLSKHSSVQAQLEENNLGLEIQFRNRLRDAELESIRLETQLMSLVEEKDEILEKFVEAERLIMQWEKKIQLAKETQDALDPNVGASEQKEMEKEVHRMKLRLSQIKRLQEKLVSEMEVCLYRHESITQKSQSINKSTTILNLKKNVAEMNRQLKKLIQDVKDVDRGIETLKESQHQMDTFINETRNACQSMQEKEEEIKQKLLQLELTKSRNAYEVIRFQKQVKRFMEVRDGKYHHICKVADQLPIEFKKQQEKMGKIQQIVNEMDERFPTFAPYFEHMRQLQVVVGQNSQ